MIRFKMFSIKREIIDFFSQTQSEITNEEEKRARFKKDNIRRRHNFLPMVVEVIKQMAAQGKLVPAVEKVKLRVYPANSNCNTLGRRAYKSSY